IFNGSGSPGSASSNVLKVTNQYLKPSSVLIIVASFSIVFCFTSTVVILLFVIVPPNNAIGTVGLLFITQSKPSSGLIFPLLVCVQFLSPCFLYPTRNPVSSS